LLLWLGFFLRRRFFDACFVGNVLWQFFRSCLHLKELAYRDALM